MKKILLLLLLTSSFVATAQVEIEKVNPVEIQLSSAAPACGLVRIRCCSPQPTQSGPLVIINGNIADETWMETINPNRIKSIMVLKGETALAIYGARATAGVIIVQTKGKISLSPDYTLTPDEIPTNLFTLYEQHNFGGNKPVHYLLNGKKRKLNRLKKLDTGKILLIKVYTDRLKSTQMGFSGGSVVVNILTLQR